MQFPIKKQLKYLLNLQELEALFAEQLWIKLALNCNLKASVCILDTGPVWKYPLKSPPATPNSSLKLPTVKNNEYLNCSNRHEIFIVTSLVDALLNVNNRKTKFFVTILLVLRFRAAFARKT